MRRFCAFSAVLVSLAACSRSATPSGASPADSGTPDASGSSSGASSSGAGGCSFLVEELPAYLTVVSMTGEALPCAATITLVGDVGVSSTDNCDPHQATGAGSCPWYTGDAGSACVYALSVASDANAYGEGTYAFDVSQAGFETQVVPDVSTGYLTCDATLPGSQITVVLQPAPLDASVDAPDGD